MIDAFVLASLIFGAGGLPADLPTSVGSGDGPLGSGVALVEDLGSGIVNTAYFYDAGGSSLCLVHQGHASFSELGVAEAASAALSAGCDTITFEMIGEG